MTASPARLALAIAALVVAAGPAVAAAAGPTCIVTDPTGTPLNVRAKPNGTILGALHNGAIVALMDGATDARGREWSFIEPAGAGKAGWVFREFLTCD